MPPFEKFSVNMPEPVVRIDKYGYVAINADALAALDSPQFVTLLFDREARRIGLGKAERGKDDAFPVTELLQGIFYIIGGSEKFSNHYGIVPAATGEFRAHLEDDILVAELDQ
jgi:hypothetical protein